MHYKNKIYKKILFLLSTSTRKLTAFSCLLTLLSACETHSCKFTGQSNWPILLPIARRPFIFNNVSPDLSPPPPPWHRSQIPSPSPLIPRPIGTMPLGGQTSPHFPPHCPSTLSVISPQSTVPIDRRATMRGRADRSCSIALGLYTQSSHSH